MKLIHRTKNRHVNSSFSAGLSTKYTHTNAFTHMYVVYIVDYIYISCVFIYTMNMEVIVFFANILFKNTLLLKCDV